MGSEVGMKKRTKFITALAFSLAISVYIAALSIPSALPAPKVVEAKTRQSLVLPAVNNPAPPSDACQNFKVLVLVDRSGSVTNRGSTVVQQYKDQVKKVWHILHNISKTYGGYSSGYLWAFAGRTADQMPRLLAKDINKDGVVNEADQNLNDLNVLSEYDSMTQNIYFRNDSDPMYPSNQLASYGYNPKNEDTRYFTKANYTNWHESFLMAENTVQAANTASSSIKDYSMVIIITDGDPTVDDGPNHTWDTFAKNKKIDENFDGSTTTSSHVTLTKSVVDSLRLGQNVKDTTQKFAPVSVQGILIGGNSSSQTRMNNTFGSGNWYNSGDFDSTLGANLLNIVSRTCPPAPTLTGGVKAEIVSAPDNVIEDSTATYTVDITNTGTAVLDVATVTNGTVVDMPTDPTYVSEGLLSPGKKRRFQVNVHVGGGATTQGISIPYYAHIGEDPSMLVPGTKLDITGTLTTSIGVTLVPRPS
ncbi:MAG: hypothetical protein U0R17_07800 [Acidimicrobiia bacterium]